LPRLVYADWLDEQQTEDASRKAEFLRVVVALTTEFKTGPRLTLEQRQMDLARGLPTDWLPVVSRLGVENCAAAGNTVRRPLETVTFEFECPVDWEVMTATADPAVRSCGACEQNVYYCATIGEAREHARQGHCVAVDAAIPRTEGDLAPPRYVKGKIGPNSPLVRQNRVSTQVDEVSKERERAKRKS
jgi:uncharacterized protein (TIGR02996 family)